MWENPDSSDTRIPQLAGDDDQRTLLGKCEAAAGVMTDHHLQGEEEQLVSARRGRHLDHHHLLQSHPQLLPPPGGRQCHATEVHSVENPVVFPGGFNPYDQEIVLRLSGMTLINCQSF